MVALRKESVDRNSTVWTGCVYHITKAEEIAAAKNREVPNA